MPEYRLSLDFTAADDQQAERLAEAWAGTCAAEYGTRYAGVERRPDPEPCGLRLDGNECGRPTGHSGTCYDELSRVAFEDGWWADDRGNGSHAPAATGTYPPLPKEGA